jgi:hypothetical protein
VTSSDLRCMDDPVFRSRGVRWRPGRPPTYPALLMCATPMWRTERIAHGPSTKIPCRVLVNIAIRANGKLDVLPELDLEPLSERWEDIVLQKEM